MSCYLHNNIEILFISDDDSTIKSDHVNSCSKLVHITIDASYNLFPIMETKLESAFSYKDCGCELSELFFIGNSLYTFCDKTGIMYKIVKNKLTYKLSHKLSPVHIFTEGINSDVPMKIEWVAKKHSDLFLGSYGTPSGGREVVAVFSLIDKDIKYENFGFHYEKMRQIAGIRNGNGYIAFETVIFDNVRDEWLFIPRKIAYEPFDVERDETIGSTKMFRCSHDFRRIEIISIGNEEELTELDKCSGYSSAKIIPGSPKFEIFAIKTIEKDGQSKTYYQVFDRNGKIIKPLEIFSDKYKFKGVEVVQS